MIEKETGGGTTNAVGERIRDVRKSRHLTQQQLADASGVATISIHQYETGKREPRLEQIQRIAKALGTSTTCLIDGKGGICRSRRRKSKMDWIKVTPETMPPDGQKVIVTVNWKGKKEVEFGIYRKDGNWVEDYNSFDGGEIGAHVFGDVTHWMPYPEPAEG